MTPRRVLVTGAGGPAGANFIRSLREAPEEFHIVATDCNPFHLEWTGADRVYVSPEAGDPGYIDFLNDLITGEGIEFLHPQPDAEVRTISTSRHQIMTRTLLPTPATIAACQDKLASARAWKRAGLLSHPGILIEDFQDLEIARREFGLPFWLRATQGAGGTGSTPVTDLAAGHHWIQYWRARGRKWAFVAQEYLSGRDLAFQSLWHDGKLLTSQARERLEYIYPRLAPSGITGTPAVAVTVWRDDVNDIAVRAIRSIDPKPEGIFCVDLKEDRNGVPVPTEINAGRFFTTSYFFTRAGSNMPYYYVKLGLGEAIPGLPEFNALPAGLYWIRHIDCPTVLKKKEELRCPPI